MASKKIISQAADEISCNNNTNLELQLPYITDINIFQCPFCWQINPSQQFNYSTAYDPNKPQLEFKSCKKRECRKAFDLSIVDWLTKVCKLPYICNYVDEYYRNLEQSLTCHLRDIRIIGEEPIIFVGCKSSCIIEQMTFSQFDKCNPGKLKLIYQKINYPIYYPTSLQKLFDSAFAAYI